MFSFVMPPALKRRLTLVCGIGFLASALAAKESDSYLWETRSFQTPQTVQAVAMSADEALIAVAMNPSAKQAPSETVVRIYDRQSTHPVALIEPKVKSVQTLHFDPRYRRLAIVSSEQIQIWNLENFSTAPESALPRDFLEWEREDGAVSSVQFSRLKNVLRWSEDNQLLELSLKNFSSALNSVWTGELKELSIRHFSFDPLEQSLALSFVEASPIQIINPEQQRQLPKLDYHLFPVVSVGYIRPDVLISLDTERHLIWGSVTNRVKIHGPVLEGIAKGETTAGFHSIYQDQYFLILTQNPNASQESYAYVFNKKGTMLHRSPLTNLASAHVSPTGAYLLIATASNSITIHKTRVFQQPEDYIRQLYQMGASETARRYRNHLEQIPPQLAISETTEPTSELQTLLDHLKGAVAAGKWAEVQSLADTVLKKSPDHPEALEALQLLSENQDLAFLEQGKRALEIGESEQAVRAFIKIPQESVYYAEARQLIEVAEQQTQIAAKLKDARHEMQRHNWAGARALIQRVLTQHPQHQDALLLLKNLESQESGASAGDTVTILIVLGLLTIAGTLIFRQRHQVLQWLAMEEAHSPVHLKPPLRARVPPQEEKQEEETPYRKYYFETLEKAQEMLRLAKKADVHRLHTALLIDFEAELKVIQKNATAADADFKHCTSQLLVILQTIRGLKFEHERHRPHEERTSSKQQTDQSSEKASAKSPPPLKDYYKILGISPQAPSAEIKKAFHQKLKEYHPDRHQNTDFEWIKTQAEAMTIEIKEAYDILSNEETRQRYDRQRGQQA